MGIEGDVSVVEMQIEETLKLIEAVIGLACPKATHEVLYKRVAAIRGIYNGYDGATWRNNYEWENVDDEE